MVGAGVQAVVVATPHPAHAAVTVPALRAGAHAIVEKPLASSLEDCDAMIGAARARAGRTLAMISQRRLYAPVLRVRQAIDAGKLGRPVLGTVDACSAGGARSTTAATRGGAAGTARAAASSSTRPRTRSTSCSGSWARWTSSTGPGRTSTTRTIEVEDTVGRGPPLQERRPRQHRREQLAEPGALRQGLGARLERGDGGRADGRRVDVHRRDDHGHRAADQRRLDGAGRGGDARPLAGGGRRLLPRRSTRRSTTTGCRSRTSCRRSSTAGEPLVSGEEGRKTVEIFTAIYRSQRDGRPVKFPLQPETGRSDFDGRKATTP